MNTQYLLILCALMTLMFSCENMDKPQFKAINNVKLNSINMNDGLNVKLSGDVTFFNPNDVNVDVSELDADVYVNGKKVTKVTQSAKTKMNASEDFTIPLTCNIPLESVFNDIKGGFLKKLNLLKKRKIDIKLDGTLKTTKAGVSMEVPFTYSETHELSLISSSSSQ